MVDFKFEPNITNECKNSCFHIEEVDCYSQISESKIVFNDVGLATYAIPKRLTNKKGKSLMNLKRGLTRDFKFKVFGEYESRIGNLLRVMIHWEYLQNKANASEKSAGTFRKPKIVSHTGLYKDIAVNDDKYPYDVVCYQDQIFFSSTDRRLNNTAETSYIGIKFEQFLTTSTVDRIAYEKLSSSIDHFKTLNVNTFDGKPEVNCISVSELDACKSKEKNVDRIYVEMKSSICRKCNAGLKNMSNKALLNHLCDASYFFKQKLFNWLNQSLYSGCKYIVVGIRDASFNVHVIRELSLQEIIDFLSQRDTGLYSKYMSSVDKTSQVLEWVQKTVEDGKVYKFKISPVDYSLEEVKNDVLAEKNRNITLIKEFRDWREKQIVPKDIENSMLMSDSKPVAPLANAIDKLAGEIEKIRIDKKE